MSSGDEEHVPALLKVGCLYLRRGRGDQLLRLICVDHERQIVILKPVAAKWDRVEKIAVELPLDEVRKLERLKQFEETGDYVRPPFLSLGDEELKRESGMSPEKASQWLAARDNSFEIIRELVSPTSGHESISQRLSKTYSPVTFSKVVREHAEKTNVDQLKIRRLLHKFAWFGLTKNALLDRHMFKGSSAPFTRVYKSKPGRVPNVAKVYGVKYLGRAVRSSDLKIFLTALQLFYVKQKRSLTNTYELMIDVYYLQSNQYGWYAIRHINVPTFRQFQYAARKLISQLKLDVERAGSHDGKELDERRGRHTDIGEQIGDVYDCDGTPFNKELVSEFKVDGQGFNVNKATAVIICDRASGKAMGWHMYLGTENWREGYRLALFCALTSKTERLKWLEIDDPTAWPDNENILPNLFYVDGGPGASEEGRAVLDRIGVDFHRAPPDSPFGKGLIEGEIGIVEEDQANDGGGYRRTRSQRDRSKRRDAKKTAEDTVRKAERKLVLALMRTNRSFRPYMQLPIEMKRDGVNPTPQEMFSWGVKRMGGATNRVKHEADLYEALLPHEEAIVTRNGIRKLNATYQSDRLRVFRRSAGENVPITVMYDPLKPDLMYWRTPDGFLEKLERIDFDERALETVTAAEIKEYQMRMTALGVYETKKVRRKGMLTNAQRQQLLEMAGALPKKKRNAPTKASSFARGAEAKHHQASHPAYNKVISSSEPTDLAAWRDLASNSPPIQSDAAEERLPKVSKPHISTSEESFGPAKQQATDSLGAGRATTAQLFAARRNNKKQS